MKAYRSRGTAPLMALDGGEWLFHALATLLNYLLHGAESFLRS